MIKRTMETKLKQIVKAFPVVISCGTRQDWQVH